MIRIFSSPYILTPRQDLNAASAGAARRGSLLKVEWGDGLRGFADLHPWPELGDLPLKTQLAQLTKGQLTPLGQQSLSLARRDAELRQAQKNIFDVGVPVVNNFLLSDLRVLNSDLLKTIKSDGFSTVKVKVGRDVFLETQAIRLIAEAGLRLRLDFNAVGSLNSYQKFMGGLSPEVRDRIEYVEDPFPFEFSSWNEARHFAPLALDHQYDKVPWASLSSLPFDVLVVKPAKVDVVKALELCQQWQLKATVTSNMDHPVGIMHALGLGMELKKKHGNMILEAGCLTHHLYQSDSFAAELSTQGPCLRKVRGTGVGFDELLEALPWQILNID